MTAIDHATRAHAAGLALALVREHAPDLEPALSIEWSPRFTSRLGDALFTRVFGQRAPRGAHIGHTGDLLGRCVARVRFSIPLWPRASKAERDETVAHEVAHLVVAYRHAVAIIEWRARCDEELHALTGDAYHRAMGRQYGRGPRRPSAHGAEWRAVMVEMGYTPNRTHNVDRTGLTAHTLYCHACGESHAVGPRRFAKQARHEAAGFPGGGYLCRCAPRRARRYLRTTPAPTR